MRKKSFLCVLLCVSMLFSAACGTDGTGEPAATLKPAEAAPKITFDTGLGAYVPPLTAEPGAQISAPAPPENEGYRFGGWYYDGLPYEFFLMPGKNITLTAKWVKVHSITFVTGAGATALNPVGFAEGETIILPENPSRTGYLFVRWESGGAEFTLTEMPASDLVLTAAWLETNAIEFDLGAAAKLSGVHIDPLYAKAGEPVSAPEAPRMPGYVFYRWVNAGGNTFTFDVMPAARVTTLTAEWFEASVLPSMLIDLSDGFGNTVALDSVDRTDYVKSVVTLQNAGEKDGFQALPAEFRGRGNGSWSENDGTGKRGYRIKFQSKIALFGGPKSKHYALVACTNAGGNGGGDKTMMQNALAYGLGREVFDGIEYTTRSYFVDIYVNGKFRGVYVLAEIVRVEEGRVDIESEYGVNDTGYLIEYDSYATTEGPIGVYYFEASKQLQHPFTVKSPDPDDYAENGLTEAQWKNQVAWIKAQTEALMTAIFNRDYAAFSALADVDSFVDTYLLHELFKNVDTGWSSLFLYKKPGGKFYMGSPWDFDMSANTTRGDRSVQNLYVAGTGAGSCIAASPHTHSEMFHALYNTPGFYNAAVQRWKALSPKITAYINKTLSPEAIESYRFAMGRNFKNFPVYGYGNSQSAAEAGWVLKVNELKNWLLGRTDWLTDTGPWK